MCLVGEQKITNYMGVRINPTAALRPVTHDHMFKMLNPLGKIRLQPVSIHNVLQTHAQKTEVGRNSTCATAELRCTISTLFLHTSLYLGFGTAIYARKVAPSSQVLVNTREHMSIRENIVADVLQARQWRRSGKTRTQNAYRPTPRRKAACTLLLLTAHLPTARTDCAVRYLTLLRLHEYAHARAHLPRFDCC